MTMIRKVETFAMTVLLVGVYCSPGLGQAPPPTILYIDTENVVTYHEDTSDVSKFAMNPGIVNRDPAPRNFGKVVLISDVVSVNGQPARGTLVFNSRNMTLSPTPNAGEGVADVARNGVIELMVEILKTDGAPIGTIMALGLAMGSPPPGSPLAQIRANNAIVGGTGAFLGVRGQFGASMTGRVSPARMASMSEDPANRRRNGGGIARYALHVIPMARPEVVITPSGPGVFHADFSQVTAAKPARAGELLILTATGLGPTLPGVDPGQPFPANPLQEVNSPVEVTVNGKPAEVINKIGYPGTTDTYRVDIRVPEGTAPGTATVQLSVAWITGSEVKVAIR